MATSSSTSAAFHDALLQETRRSELKQLKEARKERAKAGNARSFSGKQKKQQLRDHKQRVAERRQLETLVENAQRAEEYEAFFSHKLSLQESHDQEDHGDFMARLNRELQQANGANRDDDGRMQLTVALGRNTKQAMGKQLSSFFVKETKEQIQLRLMEGQNPLDFRARAEVLRAKEMVRDPLLDHPKRPKWNYSMSKTKVDNNETIMFDKWLDSIHNKYDNSDLSHFEHNLEVWRELWRVIERSSHIVIVADIRNPLLHIPPSLYEFVTAEAQKPLVVVLNKVDLVPRELVACWKAYLIKRFPRCQFVCFSSRSECVGATTDIPARRRLLSKKVDVCEPCAIDGATEILVACGVEASRARQVIEKVNLEPTEEENAMTKKPSRRRASRRKQNKQRSDVGDSEAHAGQLFCEHCAERKASYACRSCIDQRYYRATPSYSEGFLLCARCNEEEHRDVHGHHPVRLQSSDPQQDGQEDSIAPTGVPITVGLLGHPNVGKSSVLNALAGKKTVSVSHTPGHTRRLQTIMISNDICICDCPGLVFPFAEVPKFLQELSGLYPYAQIREPLSAVRFLAEHLPIEKLLALKPRSKEFDDKTEDLDWSPYTICEAYAEKKSYRTDRTGRPDFQRAGAELIRDTMDGIVPLWFYPPDYCEETAKAMCHSPAPVATPEQQPDVRSDPSDSEEEAPKQEREEHDQEEEVQEHAPQANPRANRTVNAFSLLDSDDSSDASDSDSDVDE